MHVIFSNYRIHLLPVTFLNIMANFLIPNKYLLTLKLFNKKDLQHSPITHSNYKGSSTQVLREKSFQISAHSPREPSSVSLFSGVLHSMGLAERGRDVQKRERDASIPTLNPPIPPSFLSPQAILGPPEP